ncbi:hypothetical protein [Sandaracinus amylolyticus]|uniref:Outer membrane protein beta-barrel domain-containing protein n=1 Tax=Sandaracinus amylolyticus TaxID=927083 RepID=A0A0F6YFH1_9BACT|nr:hypothetical protein [Sandaracinus amylolyticus]AKF03663.1 hypothetical protein DB32_000812 [Sandaracinus amylolyticus]
MITHRAPALALAALTTWAFAAVARAEPEPLPPSYESAQGPATQATLGQGEDLLRLRFALEAGAGVAIDPDALVGGALHVGARLGVQWNDWVALYWQGRLIGAGADVGAGRTGWTNLTSNLVGADLTIVDVLQVGAGVGIDWATADVCGRRLCWVQDEGLYAGVDARLTFMPIIQDDLLVGVRNAMAISLAWHGTIVDRGVLSVVTLSIGWEMY